MAKSSAPAPAKNVGANSSSKGGVVSTAKRLAGLVPLRIGRAAREEMDFDDGTSYDQLCDLIVAGGENGFFLEEGIHWRGKSVKMGSIALRVRGALRDPAKRGKKALDGLQGRPKLSVRKCPAGTLFEDAESGEQTESDHDSIWLVAVGGSSAEAETEG